MSAPLPGKLPAALYGQDNLLNYLLVVSRIIPSADFASVRKRALSGSARFLIFPGKATAVQDARYPRIVCPVQRYGFCLPVFRVIQIDRRSFSSFAALRHSNIVSCRAARPPVSDISGAARPETPFSRLLCPVRGGRAGFFCFTIVAARQRRSPQRGVPRVGPAVKLLWIHVFL